jgi:hypothetical protein
MGQINHAQKLCETTYQKDTTWKMSTQCYMEGKKKGRKYEPDSFHFK